MTSACPPSIVAATTEFVVPRSMPTAFAMSAPLGVRQRSQPVCPRAPAAPFKAARTRSGHRLGLRRQRPSWARTSTKERDHDHTTGAAHARARTTYRDLLAPSRCSAGIRSGSSSSSRRRWDDLMQSVWSPAGAGERWRVDAVRRHRGDRGRLDHRSGGAGRRPQGRQRRAARRRARHLRRVKEKERKGVLRRRARADRTVRVPRDAARAEPTRSRSTRTCTTAMLDRARAQVRAGEAPADRGQGG